ncbi:hypothetical protein GF406_18300 [candidate division KSB1 bacterium]|nr:hypothetical protein [candidate division KSB1 bacterium]
MTLSERIQESIQHINNQQTFIQELLINCLNWPIPDDIEEIGDISYEWSSEDLRAEGLAKRLVDGSVYQIRTEEAEQKWGIFLLEFKNEDVFIKNRGLTGSLRKVLRGVIKSRAGNPDLPYWDRSNLLFICTDRNYKHYRFAYFKEPEEKQKAAPLSLFGWNLGDSSLHTLCQYNLPALLWTDDPNQAKWHDAFSIEKVTKTFFDEIALLFTDLVGGTRGKGRNIYNGKNLLKLPDKQSDTVRKEFAVRLIGRLIFCWFLKKKTSKADIPLVPDEILSLKAMDKITGIGGYYHSVLEPLFFELLNTPAEERKKEYKKQPWSFIPFLNGGLFTPHEDDFYDLSDIGTSMHINTLKVPDEWIRELFEVFEKYNFTIDENTPVDVEMAIEPEMLGRIFENLLAEINPETGETARKATGSYYTPRPIVEYMVDESLKQYLGNKTGIAELKITELLSYRDQDGSRFTEKQKKSLVEALHSVKIIDPACGSGAFPMGILQKILLILQKLDPDSKIWLRRCLPISLIPCIEKN